MANAAERIVRVTVVMALLFSPMVNAAEDACSMHHGSARGGQSPLSKHAGDRALNDVIRHHKVCGVDSPLSKQCKCKHSCDNAAGSCTHVTVGLTDRATQYTNGEVSFESPIAVVFSSVILPTAVHPPSLTVV